MADEDTTRDVDVDPVGTMMCYGVEMGQATRNDMQQMGFRETGPHPWMLLSFIGDLLGVGMPEGTQVKNDVWMSLESCALLNAAIAAHYEGTPSGPAFKAAYDQQLQRARKSLKR